MTNLEKFKQMVSNMTVEEITEYFGGDSCENSLCAFVGMQGLCCKKSVRYIPDDQGRSCRECIETFLRLE